MPLRMYQNSWGGLGLLHLTKHYQAAKLSQLTGDACSFRNSWMTYWTVSTASKKWTASKKGLKSLLVTLEGSCTMAHVRSPASTSGFLSSDSLPLVVQGGCRFEGCQLFPVPDNPRVSGAWQFLFSGGRVPRLSASQRSAYSICFLVRPLQLRPIS